MVTCVNGPMRMLIALSGQSFIFTLFLPSGFFLYFILDKYILSKEGDWFTFSLFSGFLCKQFRRKKDRLVL